MAVILATQSLSDLHQSPLCENLLDCVKTRFYLPNYDAPSELVKSAYEHMGLSSYEINLIAKAQPKQDYYFVKNSERVMLNLCLNQSLVNLLSFAGSHQRAFIDELYQQYGALFYRYAQPGDYHRYRQYHDHSA